MQRADTPTDRRRHRGAAHALAAGVALLGVVLLVAGCGGGGGPGVASVKTTTSGSTSSATGSSGGSPAGGSGPSTSSGGGAPGVPRSSFALAGGNRQNALKFSTCMRANGLPNFPDPNASGLIQGNSGAGLDPGSPQFQAAQKKCEKYAPGGVRSPAQEARAAAQALRFAACMRSHGVKSFPDPQISAGRISIQIKGGPGTGLDPSSPLFQRAQQACGSALPGANGAPRPFTSGG